MKKFVFLMVSLFYCFILHSQNVTIKGTIIASSDGLPIANVNISIKGTNHGVSSDKDGKFFLENVKLPVILSFSHLAYFSKDLQLTKDSIKKGKSIVLNIELSDKTTNLSEVVIRDDSPVYQLERLVYDFEVDSSNLYVISNSNGEKLLQVYSFEDYLINKIFIPDECDEITYDYSKQLSLKQKDNESYYKIMFDKENNIKLNIVKYDVIERGFLRIISDRNNYKRRSVNFVGREHFKANPNNIFNTNQIYILNSFADSKFFYYYSSMNKCFTLLKIEKYKDELKFTIIYYALYALDDWFKDEPIPNYKIRIKHNPYFDRLYQIQNENEEVIVNLKSIIKANEILDDMARRFRKPLLNGKRVSPPGDLLVLYTKFPYLKIPVYIGEMSDNLYVFNFEKMNLYKLSDNGTLLLTLKIDSSFIESDFKYLSDIYINEEKTRCFIRYDLSQKTQLKEIDLQTGKYIRTITLETPYVEKIRMIRNYIYYTARTEGINAFERGLFKQKIEY